MGSLFNLDEVEPSPHDVRPLARRDNAPQQDGAELAQPFAGKQAMSIVQVLSQDGPLPREEICCRTGIKIASACARLAELQKLNLVHIAGRTKAASGVSVWCYRAGPKIEGATRDACVEQEGR